MFHYYGKKGYKYCECGEIFTPQKKIRKTQKRYFNKLASWSPPWFLRSINRIRYNPTRDLVRHLNEHCFLIAPQFPSAVFEQAPVSLFLKPIVWFTVECERKYSSNPRYPFQ